MNSFLEEVANNVVLKYGDELSSIKMIVPNKRTGFHFKKSLAKSISKTVWSPKIFTIQQYLSFTTGFTTIDKLSLVFRLYKSFKNVDSKFNFDFDSFYNLAVIILNDFNEIDSYLVEPQQIFSNIKNIHEIDYQYGGLTYEQIEIIQNYWRNFSPENLSKEKEKFLELWNLLPLVYLDFTQKLRNEKLGYEGLIYRVLSEMISEKEIGIENEKEIIFIGFNALNKAQKKLFRYLKTVKKASFFWDNDKYYHNDKKQEAGDFLRVNYEILKEPIDKIPYNFNIPDKKMNLFAIPGNVAQSKSIQTILKNYFDYESILKNPEKTVVVLPDETMLFPVLYSIPDEINQINISMGFPLKNTSLFNLLNFFLKIQVYLSTEKNDRNKVYFKDVMSVLNHPLIYYKYKDKIDELIIEINKKQLSYIGIEILLTIEEKIFEIIFTPAEKLNHEKSLLTKLLNLLFILFTDNKESEIKSQSVDNEFIYQVYVSVKRLDETIEKNKSDIVLGFPTIVNLLKQIFSQLRVPFESESTNGLQIMGLIETRNLDFENVILLNANEGVLPNLNRAPSLISESMRYAFNMPVLKFQDAIFAYFFYSLIQRAKNIAIVYNNLSGNNKSGELSRFVKQIELESDLKINKIQIKQDLEANKESEIIVNKNEKIIEELKKYFFIDGKCAKQLTATAIDTYLSCPLRFYFKYIAKLKEPDKISEEFSPMELGNIIHYIMEIMYTDLRKDENSVIVNPTDIDNLNSNVDKYIDIAFKNQYKIHPDNEFDFSGNLLIIREVIKKYILNILKIDKQFCPFEIIQLEDNKNFNSSIEIEIDGDNKNIAIKGIIDRIDKKDNVFRIIDYKTGEAKKDIKSISELFLINSNYRKKAIFQIFFYGLLLQKMPEYKDEKLKPAIYDVKSMYDINFNPFIINKSDKELVELNCLSFNSLLIDYELELKKVIGNIFNKDIAFSQTDEKDNCKFCPFRVICAL
ncbi:MAG: PD-(D/E)XK nuclease family protein [Bacteroidales bacterium]|nr:PD-(D/E)XK nuclease family protein [Bacteroidales bacterium]